MKMQKRLIKTVILFANLALLSACGDTSSDSLSSDYGISQLGISANITGCTDINATNLNTSLKMMISKQSNSNQVNNDSVQIKFNQTPPGFKEGQITFKFFKWAPSAAGPVDDSSPITFDIVDPLTRLPVAQGVDTISALAIGNRRLENLIIFATGVSAPYVALELHQYNNWISTGQKAFGLLPNIYADPNEWQAQHSDWGNSSLASFLAFHPFSHLTGSNNNGVDLATKAQSQFCFSPNLNI